MPVLEYHLVPAMQDSVSLKVTELSVQTVTIGELCGACMAWGGAIEVQARGANTVGLMPRLVQTQSRLDQGFRREGRPVRIWVQL